MKFKRLARKFPAFVAEFDGSASDCFLSFYYKLNKARGVFEFKSAEDEDEVADLLGVSLHVTENEDNEPEVKTLTKEEVVDFLVPRLAKWQLPDDVVFIDEVPKTSVGKFSKKTLRDRFADYVLPTI